MRVSFVRVPDHQRGYALVTRDDGVRYRLNDGPATGRIPHDLVHYTVESALRVGDGIWASIAGGVVFTSMDHVSGRRPPHAARRSAELMRANSRNLSKAEVIANLVEQWAKRDPAARETARWLSVRFGFAPAAAEMEAAVARLAAAAAEWARLAPGDELAYVWPAHRKVRSAA